MRAINRYATRPSIADKTNLGMHVDVLMSINVRGGLSDQAGEQLDLRSNLCAQMSGIHQTSFQTPPQRVLSSERKMVRN
jgi:hypothetical protein